MPTHPVKKNGKTVGYQWGHQKVYKTKWQADAQGRAIHAAGWKGEHGSVDSLEDMRRIELDYDYYLCRTFCDYLIEHLRGKNMEVHQPHVLTMKFEDMTLEECTACLNDVFGKPERIRVGKNCFHFLYGDEDGMVDCCLCGTPDKIDCITCKPVSLKE